MTKTKTNKKEVVDLLFSYLDEILPNASCELIYKKDYELAIAVILSAQTTDNSVNKVTPILFDKYKSIHNLANANVFDVENIIKSIGLYKNKASNIVAFAKELEERFDSILPSDKKDLTSLSGVGNKTAGVIRCEVFKIPDLPVDTHILRITKRLNLASKDDDADKTEAKLKKLIEEKRWIKTHHQLIHFGRYYCKAKNPLCNNCKVKDYCNYFKYNSSTTAK